ncbi:hypothetical protein FOZ60_000972 [Perkinsus olseni]|uniref:Uncharacterized protein n=1 Tax=Perkinsus olseni TaxID=32597 RepID=A0A7J6P3T8_PEROL|nr:hypothetical protein FOZ60_000972 [Perkinsus olseni]
MRDDVVWLPIMASVPSEGPTGCQPSEGPQAERSSSTTKASKDSPSSGGRQSPSRSSTREGIGEGLSLTSASVITIARRLSRRSVKPVTPVLKRRRGSAPMVNAALKGTVTHNLPPEAMGGRRASADGCLRPKSQCENQSGVNAPKSNTSYSVESSAQRLIEGSGMINSGKLTRTSSIPMRFSLTR